LQIISKALENKMHQLRGSRCVKIFNPYPHDRGTSGSAHRQEGMEVRVAGVGKTNFANVKAVPPLLT